MAVKYLPGRWLIILSLSCLIYSEHIELDKFVFSERSCELESISSSTELTNILANLIADQNGFKYAYYNGYRYLADFTEVTCKNTTLEKLPSMLFQEFSMLKLMNASNVELQEIIRDDFKFAVYLTDLDLSSNNLTHLENKIFMHLTELQILDISRNQIVSIHDGAFEEIGKNLSSVNLGFNKIEEFSENHLVALAKNKSNSLTINLEGNRISQITPLVNSSFSGNVKIKLLNMQNNKIKIFESSKLEIAELNLNNNQLENLILPPTIEVLEANNNKLKELFVVDSMRNASAINNEIIALKCDKNLSIESLNLSGNKITNEIFVELRHADKMKFLDLSQTPLGTLRVDAFSEMKFLEKLNLGNTKIMKISFGLFSHQQNLQVLNIAHNHLGFIDYHMFTSLKSLKSWNVSGNNLTKLKDYGNFREIFMKMSSIAIDENNWECEYLSKLILNLTRQRIRIEDPVRPVKNESSLQGIGCSEHEHARSNNDEHFTGNKFNDPIEQQKLVNQQLFHKINEQSFEIEKQKIEHSNLSGLKTILIMIMLMVFILLLFVSFPRIKTFVKSNLQRMNQSRASRQSSVITIATFDNSNV